MFLTDVRIEVDKESELCFTLTSPTCGDVAVSAPTPHERGNWLKKIAIAQKHISDTERSILQRKHSSECAVQINNLFWSYVQIPIHFQIYTTNT